MSVTLKHFDALTQRGLKIIPLRENSKIPMCKGWTNWNLLENRSKILQCPNCNLGILLGEIVDVEGDNEEANQIIADLVGDCPHPS